MKRKTLVLFLVFGVTLVAIIAYAAGARSNLLTREQTSFGNYQLSSHQNTLKATVMRDTLINHLTLWAKNHEMRLQVLAHGVVPRSPILDQFQTSFTELLSTKHSNVLTAEMWDRLISKLTKAITNHEMRLRGLETKPPMVNGKCGTEPGTCIAGTVKGDDKQTAGGSTRTWLCEGAGGGAADGPCRYENIRYGCQGVSADKFHFIPKRVTPVCYERTEQYGYPNPVVPRTTMSTRSFSSPGSTLPSTNTNGDGSNNSNGSREIQEDLDCLDCQDAHPDIPSYIVWKPTNKTRKCDSDEAGNYYKYGYEDPTVDENEAEKFFGLTEQGDRLYSCPLNGHCRYSCKRTLIPGMGGRHGQNKALQYCDKVLDWGFCPSLKSESLCENKADHEGCYWGKIQSMDYYKWISDGFFEKGVLSGPVSYFD